jgi:hypothetical protein
VGASSQWGIAWLALSAGAILVDRAVTPPVAQDVVELDEAIARMGAAPEDQKELK